MIDNVKLFEKCLENKEPYIDEYYIKASNEIISADPKIPNNLMLANIQLIENISAYKVAIDSNNKAMQEFAIEKIITALNTSGINFSEFTSYWAIKDMSYTVYKKTFNTDELKKEFLKNILPEFIKDRHSTYLSHGYSANSLQAIKDSKAHKGNGNAGLSKLQNILNKNGFSHLYTNNLVDFLATDKLYIFPDKGDQGVFKEILKHFNIDFQWSKNHEKKQTDCLFSLNNKIYIVEHKHMKESGGGQDKQMSEIINFVSYTDPNVSYISFLDGVYFNLLADQNIKGGKPFEQRASIFNNLKRNKQNYFVNTYGFQELLNNLA
jgi:hypothetical protein